MVRENVPVARYWIVAARSAYASAEQWKGWADAEIIKSETPDNWLVDMSLANSVRELRQAVQPRLDVEQRNDAEDDDAALGYIWLRFEKGDISLAESLRFAGEEADSGAARIECESFYRLLNELEAAGENEVIRAKGKSLFSEVRLTALKQWKALFPTEGSSA